MPTPLPTPLSTGPRVWPRPKFVWGSAEKIRGRWRFGLFCAYERRPGYPGTGLAMSVRGLLRWTLVLGLSGYLAGAAVIARWFARSPYNQIKFADVLAWPVQREHVATLRGRAWLGQGKEALTAKRWAEGSLLLRKGLELCPDDFDARLALAQFLLLTGQRAHALTLLTDGAVQRLPPPEYREKVFTLAAAGEDWRSALLFSERCLLQLPTVAPPGERQKLLARKLAALIALDRAGEALTLAEAEGGAASAAVKTEQVRALRALGRAREAVDFLARWRASLPAEAQSDIVKLQVPVLREVGRFEEMERALAALHAFMPARPEPLVFTVEQRARANRGAGAALDDFLFRFGNTPANLQLVARALAEIPEVRLLQRVVAAAAEHGFPLRPFRVQLAMALLRQGDWPALAQVVAELEPVLAQSEPEGRFWFEWMQALSGMLSLPGSSPERLLASVQMPAISLEAHRLTVVALRRAGREEDARAVLAISRGRYAESPWLRTQDEEIRRALAAGVPNGAAAATGASVASVAANWRNFVRELDGAIAQSDWPAAERLVAGVRRARLAPAWLAGQDAELLQREVRVDQGLHDIPALRQALNLYLNGSSERAAEVLKLARELYARGEPGDALTLVKAVLEKSPDHPMAADLFSRWRPRRRL